MTHAQRLKILADSGKTIFSSKNLQSLWQISSQNTKVVAKRMSAKDLIIKVAKGYYALKSDYNIYELAYLIITPSYVSFHSALFYHGVSFQASNVVTSASLLNYQKKINNLIFKYRTIKEFLFYNLEGISYKKNIATASAERAILDSYYLGLAPNIDNIEKINLDYLNQLSLYYPQSVRKKIKKYFNDKKRI